MTSSLGRLRRRVFGLSLDEATFARRGFHEGDPGARQRLEHIGHTFLGGYHAALEESDMNTLGARLNEVETEFRGFAFEGAAMALALLDMLAPWTRSRWSVFVEGPGKDHVYMVHVGLGWALARLHRRVERPLSRLDPLLGWLALDGYGFHEGYFYPRRYVEAQEIPGRLSGYALHVFDQGLGRSLWFVEGADVSRIPGTIAGFPTSRRADLWSGVGLACAYAGGVERSALECLRGSAGDYGLHLGQGVAFAAKARQQAGNMAPHTAFACQVICRTSAEEAAEWTDAALRSLTIDEGRRTIDEMLASPSVHRPSSSVLRPSYEEWRRGIRAQVGKEGVAV